MDLKTLTDKVKKPWFVPAWIWNRCVESCRDTMLSALRIEDFASAVSGFALDRLEECVKDKDKDKVSKTCAVLEGAGSAFTLASAALKDMVITDDEKSSVGSAFAGAILELVAQEQVDAKVNEIADALLA